MRPEVAAGFKRILVPVDFTARSRASLDVAARIAQRDGSRVRVLHVIERIEHLPAASLKAFYARLAKAATRNLEGLVHHKWSARMQGELRFGNRAAEILRSAGAWRADLIVLASHAVSGGRADWATLSYRVAVGARCTVLLVK